MERMGKVKVLDKTVVSWDALESGTKVFWHDNIVNGLLERIPE